jgi:protein-disulfide isomerase
MHRRTVLAALLAGLPSAVLAQASRRAGQGAPAGGGQTGYGQWYGLDNDEGRPMANVRLPVELVAELDGLAGVTYVGAETPEATVYEFFDYNCPFCHKAAGELPDLLARVPTLRVGLVNNPILSPQSAQAAKVALAVLRRGGPKIAHALHQRALGTTGRMDGNRMLDIAAALGGPRAELETLADSAAVQEIVRTQLRLAASLGLHATPSYVAGTVGILGYPGPKSLERIAGALRTCGQAVCTG